MLQGCCFDSRTEAFDGTESETGLLLFFFWCFIVKVVFIAIVFLVVVGHATAPCTPNCGATSDATSSCASRDSAGLLLAVVVVVHICIRTASTILVNGLALIGLVSDIFRDVSDVVIDDITSVVSKIFNPCVFDDVCIVKGASIIKVEIISSHVKVASTSTEAARDKVVTEDRSDDLCSDDVRRCRTDRGHDTDLGSVSRTATVGSLLLHSLGLAFGLGFPFTALVASVAVVISIGIDFLIFKFAVFPPTFIVFFLLFAVGVVTVAFGIILVFSIEAVILVIKIGFRIGVSFNVDINFPVSTSIVVGIESSIVHTTRLDVSIDVWNE
mmetsp:Transcript_36364/g.87818  ORF Transcript_36364/g.87818 Transcript_36364/m.87818 type:complete len:327 (-) Transcript_36364:1279-2259(-)